MAFGEREKSDLSIFGAMNAAAPEGTPPRRTGDKNSGNFPARPCLGEALRQVSLPGECELLVHTEAYRNLILGKRMIRFCR